MVASLPHSGLFVPPEMAAHLKAPYREFLPHQDWHLDRLYDFLPRLGVTTVVANYSRYVVDLNREYRTPALGSFWRAVVPESTPRGAALYEKSPEQAEVERRVAELYRPYHAALEALLAAAVARFGSVVLLDLHSFGLPGEDEVCLGDADGRSCSEALIAAVEAALGGESFRVTRNRPFNGGHITRRYGDREGVEALQIELAYALYLDPGELARELTPSVSAPDLARARPRLERALRAALAQVFPPPLAR